MKEANLKRLHSSLISTIFHSEKGKTMETVKISVITRGWWGGREE